MIRCTSCKKEVTDDYVRFKCPSCSKSEITRCEKCRQTSVAYECAECHFRGP